MYIYIYVCVRLHDCDTIAITIHVLHCFTILMWPQTRSGRSFSCACCNQMGCVIGERGQLPLDIHDIDVI